MRENQEEQGRRRQWGQLKLAPNFGAVWKDEGAPKPSQISPNREVATFLFSFRPHVLDLLAPCINPNKTQHGTYSRDLKYNGEKQIGPEISQHT